MAKEKPKPKPPEAADNIVTRTMKSTVKTVSGIARSIYDSKPPAKKAEKKTAQSPEKKSVKAAGSKAAHHPEAKSDTKSEGKKTPPKHTDGAPKHSDGPPKHTDGTKDKRTNQKSSTEISSKEHAKEKPAEKTSLNNYIHQLKEKAKTTVNDEIERVKHTAKVVEDNLHKVENAAAKTLKEISEPKKDNSKEQQKTKPVELNKLTPEQRVAAKQFEYTDEKTKVSYKYDTKTGNLQEMQRGDTTTHIKYDKSGNAAGMEVKQGNHVLAKLDNKDSSKLKVDQVTGAVNVEAINKESKSHTTKELTTYKPDGTVTNVGFDADGHRTSKVGFAVEGDQLSRKYRVDYVYTQGDQEKPGEVFSVTRNLEEKNPAKQVTEKCWYDDPKKVEKQAPSIKERIVRDQENNTKVTRSYKDGRSEELRLDSHGQTTEFHVRNPKGYSVKYEVKNDKIVGAKVDGENFKDAKAQEAAQHDLARMKNLYNFQVKAAEAEKVEQPVGLTDYALKESKTGTVVIKTDDGIHSFHSQFGELRDKNKNLVGHLDKDGKITLEKGVDLKLGNQLIKDGSSIDQIEGSAFFDTHDIINNRKAVESNGPGKNGLLLRPDGRLGGAVMHNNVFDEKGEFIGQVDSNGTLTKSVESGKGKIDINSELRGYSFIGKEEGQDRRFIMSANMSNGEISLDDPPGKHKVEMGMILVKDQNGKMVQRGIVEAPNFASGRLDGGSITLFNGKESETKPLCESKGTVLDLEIKGEGAVKSQRIQAVCLGQQVVGPDQKTVVSGGFFDIQDAKAREKQIVVDADTKFKEKQDDVVGHWGGGFLQLGGKSDYEASKETADLAHRRSEQKLASLDQIVKDGKVDLNSLGFYNRELDHLTQTPKAKPEPKKPEEPKKVLTRPDLKDKQITGKARVGNEVIEFQNNKVIVDGKAVGEVGPDYVIRIEGRPPIDLKQEDRVLVQFKFEGPGASNETHQLVGLGKTKVGLNGRMYEGGLVDTKSLTKEATQRQLDMEIAIQEYKNGRHITSGISNYFLGDAEGTMDQQVATFGIQKSGLQKEFQTLFNEGFDPKNLDNNRVDQCTRATQQMMENCRTTTADGTELIQRTTQLEQQANEGIIMATTTIATMGVGAAFNGLANAGKLANLSKVTILTTEVGATSVVGGTISVIGRHTEKGGWDEAYTNLASGTMEGMANSLNAFGTMMKAQGIGKLGVTMSQLSKAEVNMANLAKASVKVEQLAQGEVELAHVSKAMVTVENLNKAGLTTKGLAKVGITAEELKSGAVSMERLMSAGLKEKDLAKVTLSVEELGKHALDLRKVPVALEELQRCGVPLEQLATKGVQIAGQGEKMFTIADQMLLDSKFGQLSTKVANNPMANSVLKNSLRFGEGIAQTAMYEVAAGMRSKEGINLKESLSPEKLLLGTVFNVGSQTIGDAVGSIGAMSKGLQRSENKFLKFLGEERALKDMTFKSRQVFTDFASESFNQFASRLPSEVSSAYSNGAMSAITEAIKNEKQRVAEKLGHTPTEQELYENMNYTKVLQEIHEQGLMAAASSPLISAAGSPIHAWSEKYAPKSRLPKDEPPDSLHMEPRTTGSENQSVVLKAPEAPLTPPDAPPVPSEAPKTHPNSRIVHRDSPSDAPVTHKQDSPAVVERQRQSLDQLANEHTNKWKPEYGKELGLKVVGKEGTERSFLEATQKATEALCNSGEPGDTRPIRKDMFHDVDIVKSALANNPEQLKIYNEYVDKRRAHEAAVKDLNAELESRRSDVQKMVDTYCRENGLPPIEVTRGHDITSQAKGYRNGKLDVPMNWLLKSRLGEAELGTLHSELRKVGRENETPEYQVKAAQAKTERQLADLEKLSTDSTKSWRQPGKDELGLTALEADERFKTRQEITEKLVAELCNKTGSDGKPTIEPERFHDIDYVRSKLSAEQLARYEKYVDARQKHENAERTLRNSLDERLKDLQSVMDQYCDQNHQPRVTLKRTHHLTDEGKPYSDGTITVSSRELLKSRPSDTLREFLVRESATAQGASPEIDRLYKKEFDGSFEVRKYVDYANEDQRRIVESRQLKVDDHAVFNEVILKQYLDEGDTLTKEWTNVYRERREQLKKPLADLEKPVKFYDVIVDENGRDTGLSFQGKPGELRVKREAFGKPVDVDALLTEVLKAYPDLKPKETELRQQWSECAHWPDVISNRLAALQELHNRHADRLNIPRQKLVIGTRPDAEAAYVPSTGVIEMGHRQIWFDRSDVIGTSAHETVHADQDTLLVRLAALETMRDSNLTNLHEAMNDPQFMVKVNMAYKRLYSRSNREQPNPEFFKQSLETGTSWIEKGLKSTQAELEADPQYMRGYRLADSLRHMVDDAEFSAKVEQKIEFLKSRMDSPEDFFTDNSAITLFGFELPARYRAEKAMSATPLNPEKLERAGYRYDENKNPNKAYNPLDPTFKDAAFESLMQDEKFLAQHPDFFKDLVEMTPGAEAPSQKPGLNSERPSRKWIDTMRDLTDSTSAPSNLMTAIRLELKAVRFLNEYFQHNEKIGNLEKSDFERALPGLGKALIRDQLVFMHNREQLAYKANFYETEAHHAGDMVERLRKNPDRPTREPVPFEDRSPEEQRLSRLFVPNRGNLQAPAEQIPTTTPEHKNQELPQTARPRLDTGYSDYLGSNETVQVAEQKRKPISLKLDMHKQQLRKNDVGFDYRAIHDFPNEEARDKFLHLQMKVEKHKVLQRKTIREFAKNVKDIGDTFTPVDKNLSAQEKQAIVNERVDALRKAHIDAFGEPAPEIMVLSDREMAESGADAGYLRGRGITQLRESEILGHSPFSPKPFIHEGVHVTQDKAIIQSIATDLMRQKGIESFDALKASDGSWTPEGKAFIADLQKEYKSRTAFTEFVPLNDKFFEHTVNSSREYLDKAVKLSDDALNIDPEYVRGRRHANDLKKKEQRAAERQADLAEKMLNLARALTPRDLSGDGLRTYLNELFTQRHNIEDGPNPLADVDAKKLLQKICSNPMFRNELFGNNHHLTGGIGEINQKDRQFENMLYKAVSDNDPPDFVAHIVEAAIQRSANPKLKPTESREVWLKQMEEHLNDSAAAPSTPKAFNRTELRAYAFLLDHFKNPRNGAIGSLTRQRFEEALPILMKELVKDSIKEALIHDQLVYHGNLAETETRHTDSIVDEWMQGKGADEDAPLTYRQKLYSDKLGKFWMTGDQKPTSGPSTSDGIMLSREDNPLIRMMKIQQMQEQQKYGDLNIVQQDAIPDNYYRTDQSEAKDQQTEKQKSVESDTGTKQGDQEKNKNKNRLKNSLEVQKHKEGTGESSQLPSGNEIADMPEKPTPAVGDVPMRPSTQYAQELHAHLEANRINRLNIHRQLSKSNILDHLAKAQNLITEMGNAPSDLRPSIQVMAHSFEKAKILEQILKYHDPANLPDKIADVIRNEERLTYADMRKVLTECHPSDLQVGMRLTERVASVSDPAQVKDFWKEAVQAYKRIDEDNLSKAERTQYQELGTRLEKEMRQRVSEITEFLQPPKGWTFKDRTPNGLVAQDRYAPRFDPKEGRAQEVAFVDRVATALNTNRLSDSVIAEQPEVLSKDKQLVDTIKRELKDELESETAYFVKRGLKQNAAERQALFKVIRDLTDAEREKDPDDYTPAEQETSRAINDAMNRGRDWIGLPMPSGCVLDMLGCDYMLVNKRTGEYIPLDVTVHGINKTPGQLIDCRAMNPDLKWDEAKTIPSDRKNWIMSVPDEKDWNNALFQSIKEAGGDSTAGREQLNRDAIEQISVAILATIQTPSRLNLVDHPLPNNLMSGWAPDRENACIAFSRNLERVGMHSWAADLNLRALRYIQNQGRHQSP